MTKRDFFILIIKVFGLFWVVTSLFSVIPNNISFALMDIDLFTLLWISIAISVAVGLFLILIFKADKIVQILKLEKGFDNDKIEFGNLKPIDIIRIGTFIIGGLLILENIPAFLSHALFALKGDVIGLKYPLQNKFNWAVSGLNILIGFLLITNYDYVAGKLKKNKN